MASLEMNIPHQLPKDEALKRVQGLLQQIKSQHSDKISNLHEEWSGNIGKFNFSALGFGVSGVLTVNESNVELAGDLPMAAMFFKGKIKSVIEEEAGKLLS